MARARFPTSLLAMLAICASFGQAEDDTDYNNTETVMSTDPTPSPTVTTAPIYLPHYQEEFWSVVQGSILSSDPKASKTTYTVFCPDQTPPACDLSLEFPFVIVEGPHTVQFHGTYTSTYIANVECELEGKTAATCSGYSSYKSGYTNGMATGPTEISWTSTFARDEIEWGTLTLADAPDATGQSLDASATGRTTPDTGYLFFPTETPSALGAPGARASALWVYAATLASIMAGVAML